MELLVESWQGDTMNLAIFYVDLGFGAITAYILAYGGVLGKSGTIFARLTCYILAGTLLGFLGVELLFDLLLD